MSRKPILWIASSVILLGAVAAFVFMPAKQAALLMPDLLPRQAEAKPSSEFLKSEEQVKKLRADIQAHPEKAAEYVHLADVYVQESRVTANHHFYVPVAAALIHEALRREPNNFEALVSGASLEMTLHQFQTAHDMVLRAIDENPYNATSFGVLCDANVELGSYPAAVAACDSMMARRPDLRSYARASYLRQLHGNRSDAIDAMMFAVNAGASGSEAHAWAAYQLGNLFFEAGKLDTAAFIYKSILEERPGYAYARSGLAMIHLARQDYSDAVGELVTAMQQLPEHVFLEQLSDVYLAMGDTANARTIETRVFSAFDQHEKDGWNVDREYAQYAADHGTRLTEATERAKREFARRPNNVDAAETYAWVLYKTGHAQDAIAVLDRIATTGIVATTTHYHAGAIYAAVGDQTKARHELTLALQSVPYTQIALMRNARTLLSSIGEISMK